MNYLEKGNVGVRSPVRILPSIEYVTSPDLLVVDEDKEDIDK